MKIFVKAKPNASEGKIDKVDEVHFVVSVKEPPPAGGLPLRYRGELQFALIEFSIFLF